MAADRFGSSYSMNGGARQLEPRECLEMADLSLG
jgi:hypothetical protein